MQSQNKVEFYHRGVLTSPQLKLWQVYEGFRVERDQIKNDSMVSALAIYPLNIFLYQSKSFEGVKPEDNIYWDVVCTGDGNITALVNHLRCINDSCYLNIDYDDEHVERRKL
jgi:hypothetical protein